MNKKQIAEKILIALEKQRFAEWYHSDEFDKYLNGNENALSKEEILEQIILLFHL